MGFLSSRFWLCGQWSDLCCVSGWETCSGSCGSEWTSIERLFDWYPAWLCHYAPTIWVWGRGQSFEGWQLQSKNKGGIMPFSYSTISHTIDTIFHGLYSSKCSSVPTCLQIKTSCMWNGPRSLPHMFFSLSDFPVCQFYLCLIYGTTHK